MNNDATDRADGTDGSKESWRSVRRRYTWYFRPLFNSKFERTHWWAGDNNQVDITPSAALYELVRRHPMVRETWVRNFFAAARSRRGVAVSHPDIQERWTDKIVRFADFASSPPSLSWTCLVGLKSWSTLDSTERQNWEFSVGYLKGLDLRWEELQCFLINHSASGKIRDRREQALSDKVKGLKDRSKIVQLVNADLEERPPSTEEWEAAIAECAVKAFRDGYLLFAVAPDLSSAKAAELLPKRYAFEKRDYSEPTRRARWNDWLPIISDFETAETDYQGASNQVFVRYRRAMDSVSFA